MATKRSRKQIELAELIVSVDDARAGNDVFKLPAPLKTALNDRLADLKTKDAATLISESSRAEASGNVKQSIDKLRDLLTDGYNFIKGLGGYAITEPQRLGVFTAYGWESGLVGRLTDDRVESLANQAVAATAAIANAAWHYPAPLMTLITAELATLNANQPAAQSGARQTAVAARDAALELLQTINDRVRFYYCCASDEEDRSTELAKIGRQPRRPRTSGNGLEAPKNLTLSAGEDGAIDADWDDVADVDHYVISRQRVGSDPGYVEETRTFFESEGTIGPFASGETVCAKVLAVRGDRSSADSTVAEITLPTVPGVPAVPGQPVLTAPTSDQIVADWPNVIGAMFYNVYKQDMETDPGFVLVGPSSISQATVTKLRPGATVRIRVTAGNGSGESAPSPFAEITTPGG